jgi:rhamnosyltransferase
VPENSIVNKMSKPVVIAVIVTYQPDRGRLDALLGAIIPQVTGGIIVDNGDDACFLPPTPGWHFSSMKENLGIAKAQNVGIDYARHCDASHVLLLDQDSIPAPDMVDKLLLALASVPSAACVGPNHIDPMRPKASPFVKARGIRIVPVSPTQNDNVVVSDFLVSSGCLIPMAVLETVGVMREDLFIDFVDAEWCLRARRYGLLSYGVCSTAMEHMVGSGLINVFGRRITRHAPIRNFYQMRNAVLLFRESWISFEWKCAYAFRTICRFVIHALLAAPRLVRIKMMLLGLWDGVRGRAGNFNVR